jgi:hypothetical protein
MHLCRSQRSAYHSHAGDSGHWRHWYSVTAQGLPTRTCAVTRVIAINARVAWVVALTAAGKKPFEAQDRKRTWDRTVF